MVSLHSVRKTSGWLTTALGVCMIFVFSYAYIQPHESLTARIVRQHREQKMQWKTLSAEDLTKGTSAPPSTNIIFHIPIDTPRIARHVLFGKSGKETRYWGYCFPPVTEEDAEQRRPTSREELLQTMFLSEAERAAHAQREQKRRRSKRSFFDRVEDAARRNQANDSSNPVRHRKEIFFGGETCYAMFQAPVPMGIDSDNDLANSKLENIHGTDLNEPDTDGDGVSDGLEILSLLTSPTTRDSDGDGLIDGIEDNNRNGRVDPGETNPTKLDTDNDGLCDGFCVIQQGIRSGFSAPDGFVSSVRRQVNWEDKNLNGTVEEDETDPRRRDTDGDGVSDEQEFFVCNGINGLEAGQGDC